jgi:hypothetical protein
MRGQCYTRSYIQGLNQIDLAQNRDQQWELLNTVMNIKIGELHFRAAISTKLTV